MSTQSTQQSLGSEIYTGTADFGRIWAILGAIMSTFISIIFIIIGIVIIVKGSKYNSVSGIVTSDSVCNQTINGNVNGNVNGNNNQVTTCNTSVKYTVNSVIYQKTIDTGSSSYKTGDQINIYFTDANNPTSNPIPSWIGIILIIMGVIILIGSWLWVWLTQRYKVAAAAEGVAGALSVIKRI